jgi:hypothetical protein
MDEPLSNLDHARERGRIEDLGSESHLTVAHLRRQRQR